MECLISVIVPVYKVESYLQRCVKSIQMQTYKNIEIILVDDGSPDRCPEICDELVANDKRIKVVHKSNGGLSDARNVGMEMAQGEYFCFVDSDDYIQPTMVEKLKVAIEKTGVMLAISNFMTVDESGKRVVDSTESPITDGCFIAEDLLPKIYQKLGWYYIVAWNKLYHRSLFDNIRFPFGKIHEDEYIVAQVMDKAKRIACISTEEYVYIYQRKGSIMSSCKMQSKLDWLEALYLRYIFCEERNIDEGFVKETRAVYFRELNNLFLDSEIKRNITVEQRKKAKKQYSRMKNKTNSEKINWILFNINPKLDWFIVQKIRKIRG